MKVELVNKNMFKEVVSNPENAGRMTMFLPVLASIVMESNADAAQFFSKAGLNTRYEVGQFLLDQFANMLHMGVEMDIDNTEWDFVKHTGITYDAYLADRENYGTLTLEDRMRCDLDRSHFSSQAAYDKHMAYTVNEAKAEAEAKGLSYNNVIDPNRRYGKFNPEGELNPAGMRTCRECSMTKTITVFKGGSAVCNTCQQRKRRAKVREAMLHNGKKFNY